MRQKNWWPCPESVSQPNSGVRFPTNCVLIQKARTLVSDPSPVLCYRLSVPIFIVFIVSPLNIELGQHVKKKGKGKA